MRSPSMSGGRSKLLKFPSRSRRLELETLEGRQLLAGVVAEYPTPTPFSLPGGITTGPDGALWFTEFGKIGRITTGGAVTEFPIRNYGISITTGPDGALWFTEVYADKIGRLSPTASPQNQTQLTAVPNPPLAGHP